MKALTLLSNYGIRTEAIGNDIKLFGLPKLPDVKRQQIIALAKQYKNAILKELQEMELSAVQVQQWSQEDKELIAWFLSGKHSFPLEPFILSKGVYVANPETLYRSLSNDIEQGSEGPRTLYGALQGDIRKLQALLSIRGYNRKESA
jgi:hypothetical protein